MYVTELLSLMLKLISETWSICDWTISVPSTNHRSLYNWECGLEQVAMLLVTINMHTDVEVNAKIDG